MKKKIIGTVTIGQSPRGDIVTEILQILGSDYKIIEAGALDGLSQQDVAAFQPGPGGRWFESNPRYLIEPISIYTRSMWVNSF